MLQRHAADVGRDVAEIELSNELRGRDEAEADALHTAGVRLFTVGITGPDFDFASVERWIRWRDGKNA